MALSFKSFLELSEEQLNELFGIFRNNKEADRRDALKKQTQAKVDAWKAQKAKTNGQQPADDDEDSDTDPADAKLTPQQLQQKKIQQQRQQQQQSRGPSAAAAGRNAERDWTDNM